MGDFNPSTPTIRGAEPHPVSKRTVRLDSTVKGLAMRVRPGSITASHIHTYLAAVSNGNPGFAVEVLDVLAPTCTTTAYYPGTDTGQVVTGWSNSTGSAEYSLIDDQYDTSDYMVNTAALSARSTLDLQFRGSVTSLSSVRIVNVTLKATVKLANTSGNSAQVDLRGILTLGSTTYQSPKTTVARRDVFETVEVAQWPVNPSTKVPWTLTEINALLSSSVPASDEFGLRVGGKLAASGFYVSGMWLEVKTCTENRKGFLYSATPPRGGWVKNDISDASLSADTRYWVHVYALRGSSENYFEVPVLRSPNTVDAPSAAATTGEHRRAYQTQLTNAGGAVSAFITFPAETFPLLIDSSGTIRSQSMPYVSVGEQLFYSGDTGDSYAASRGQEITTAAATDYVAVQVPVGWQNKRRRPDRALVVNVRSGTTTDSGGTLHATATLHPGESDQGAITDQVIRFASTWTSGATTQYRLFFSSTATEGRGWVIPLLDDRSDNIGLGTTAAEVDGATQGGTTDSYIGDGTANDRFDFPVALIAAPTAPASLTVTPAAAS